MVVLNAAGCSSVWGGTWGMVPYCTNADGHGPAWGNSLFEDNAEYGFGMCRSHLQRRKYLHGHVTAAVAEGSGISDELRKLLLEWLALYDKNEDPHHLIKPILAALEKEPAQDKVAIIRANADQLPKISYWICGGDGWAYDIDYGGLDHVVSFGSPVRVLVMDTEVCLVLSPFLPNQPSQLLTRCVSVRSTRTQGASGARPQTLGQSQSSLQAETASTRRTLG